MRIAQQQQTSPAALALAWAVRRGVAVIPKSAHPERVRANLVDSAAPALAPTRTLTLPLAVAVAVAIAVAVAVTVVCRRGLAIGNQLGPH